MRRSVKGLMGYTIRATDGELGKVEEFYFDDQQWIVRYLVVNTGGRPSGRRVLISTVALGKPEWESRAFPVMLTMDQVRNSPDVDTDKPVSRQHEEELHKYYSWPVYWIDGPYMGACGFPPVVPAPANLPIPPQKETDAPSARPKGDPHLRSTRTVTGYYFQAKDGEIGHVDDFILDDAEWDIRYLVVDTRNWLPARRVIVTPMWLIKVSWDESKVFTAASRESVRNSPEFDASKPISMDYEGKLYDWYGRPTA